ncbi:hypothetical protein EJB05_04582, partial [Eragrostis curvula]
MDEYFYQSLLLSVLAVALLQLVKMALRPRARLPPGPWKLPVIGSMHHLVNVLPHRALMELARVHGPLMMLRLGETPLVVASSKDTARAVLKTHDTNFATRPKLLAGEIVGYDWADILFSPIVARAAFGKKRKNAAEFMAAIKAGVGLSSGFCIPDLFPTWTTVLAKITGMKRSLQDIHETNVDENLVDVLIALQEKGGFGFHLNNSRIKAIILDMFAGGTGTSASAMEWAMSELMRNPSVMKKLQGQIREAFHGKTQVTEGDLQASNVRYLKLVIKEVLRLHPPAPLLVPRESIEACELEGYAIPSKSRVIVNVFAIGRDPKYWDDAEEFKPERFEEGGVDFNGGSYEFLPFVSGRRMCPGFNYGLASMELALVGMLYHFDWSLPEGIKEVDMEEAPGLGVRRRSLLMLCATPSHPVATSTNY